MEKEQKMYEIGYLLSPLIPEEKIDDEVAAVRKTIEENHGLILSEGRPKSRKLAYPIRVLSAPTQGFETASFGWVRFVVNAEFVPVLKTLFDKNDHLIRFLIMGAVKEVVAPVSFKPGVKQRKPVDAADKKEGEIAPQIKPEEIDKKLEEMLKEPSAEGAK